MVRHRLLSILFLVALPLSAAQAAPESSLQPRRTALDVAVELREPFDPEAEVDSETGWLGYVHIRKGAGFEFRQAVGVGERNLILGVRGPIMKRKSLGLTFEVRF